MAVETTDRTEDVGASRTFRSTPSRAWQLLASDEGAAAWLGDTPTDWFDGSDGPAEGVVIETPGGERYEVCDVEIGERIQLRTLGPLQPRTLIELSLDADRGRTVVALQQDGIPDEATRAEMREHWKRALDRIGVLLDGE